MGVLQQKLNSNEKENAKRQLVVNGVISGPQYIPYFLNTSAGNGSTASGSFVDFPGPIDKVISKKQDDTAMLVSGTIGSFKTTNGGNIYFALRINSVDYLIAQFFYNDLGTHRVAPFTAPIASGVVAGNYTARLRWRTDNASAQSDANDIIHIRFEEGLFA